MEKNHDKSHSKEKALAISAGIVEAVALIILFGLIASNIEKVSVDPTMEFTLSDLSNEICIWITCIISTFIIILILAIVGAVKDNYWMMIPSVGLHVIVLVFIFIVLIMGIIRLNPFPQMVIGLSLIGTTALGLAAGFSLAVGIYFGILIQGKGK